MDHRPDVGVLDGFLRGRFREVFRGFRRGAAGLGECMKVPHLLRSGECIEAHVCGELASSAVIVPGRKDKGTGVYIVRFFMYLPHAIALRASLTPGTLALDDPVFRLFQQMSVVQASE